jgi:predicted nucleotidyltransferase component of viral defense system
MDRFSEDLDFSLLKPMNDFDLFRYSGAVERELQSFGFEVKVTTREKKDKSPVQSAFLEANTLKHLLTIKTAEETSWPIPSGQILKIKIEVDTDPPSGFSTENKFVLQPIPFSVRTYVLPDLFAGKMHAVLCRRWKNRVKGRDWYDLVWYAANHPKLNLNHLEQRMIQSGNLKQGEKIDAEKFFALTAEAIDKLDVNQARKEVEPFVKYHDALEVWSGEFFKDVIGRIVMI